KSLTFTSTGNTTGVFLNGTTAANIILTAPDITLNGTALSSGTGLNISGATLNATHLNLTGVAKGGAGFSLNNITLAGNVAGNLSNLTLNSSGSGSGVVNVIGSGIINNASDFTEITSRKLGSVTQVDAAYWDKNNKTLADGLNLSAAANTDGWIYSGVNVTVSGGDTILNNIGFVNPKTLNISGDSL
ncbi:hypothetical protein ACDA27_004705, partial [Salmonella enterica]